MIYEILIQNAQIISLYPLSSLCALYLINVM